MRVCFGLYASGNRGHSIIGNLNKSYLEAGRTRLGLEEVLNIEAAVIPMGQNEEMFGHFCGLDNVHVSSLFRENYKLVLFLS